MFKRFALAAALAVALLGAVAVGTSKAATQNGVFVYLTTLTGSEVVENLASATGNVFKTSVLAQYVTRVFWHATMTTVALLPSCAAGTKGYTYYVTDASSPTYGGTLTGSSTSFAVAICDGTNWTAH